MAVCTIFVGKFRESGPWILPDVVTGWQKSVKKLMQSLLHRLQERSVEDFGNDAGDIPLR